MGQSIKELRQRISGVKNIQKITRAMEMVAATKLRRLQTRAEGTRPYADTIRKLSATLAGGGVDVEAPLLKAHDEVKRVGLLVLSSDRGLCGSFNTNVFRQVSAFADRHPERELELMTLGRKARQFFPKRRTVREAFEDEVEKIQYRRAATIAGQLAQQFIAGSSAGGFDEVWIAYTRFASATKQIATVEKLLPIEPTATADGESAGDGAGGVDLLLEPSAEELLELLLPKSLAVRIYAALLDSLASEFAARRVAMKAATDAAGDMISNLRRLYNRARQESITSELLDIVGGAEALS